MFQAPEAKFVPSHANQQKHAPGSPVGGAYKSGKVHTLTAEIPKCYFQMDINTGRAYKPGDYTLDKLGRLLLASNGGTKKCTEPKPTTTVKPTTTTVKQTTTTMPVVHKASATAAEVCKADASGWTVTYKNSGSSSEKMTLESNGETLDEVTVAAGKSVTKSYSYADHEVDENQTIKMTVKAYDKTVATLEATNNCIEPAASIVQECADDAAGFNVTYTNEGPADQTFTLMYGNVLVDTVTIAKGAPAKTVNYGFDNDKLKLAKDESAELVVKANDKQLATETVTNNCIDADADVVAQCNTAKGSGAVFTFTNSGRTEETFNVYIGDKLVEGSPVKVAAGATSTQIINLVEDTPVNFTIKSELSGLDIDKTVQVDCVEVSPTTVTTAPPTEVLGEQVVREEQLAHTGTETKPMLMLGSLLVLAGFGVIGMARRFRTV
jgi:hypothetical protein